MRIIFQTNFRLPLITFFRIRLRISSIPSKTKDTVCQRVIIYIIRMKRVIPFKIKTFPFNLIRMILISFKYQRLKILYGITCNGIHNHWLKNQARMLSGIPGRKIHIKSPSHILTIINRRQLFKIHTLPFSKDVDVLN